MFYLINTCYGAQLSREGRVEREGCVRDGEGVRREEGSVKREEGRRKGGRDKEERGGGGRGEEERGCVHVYCTEYVLCAHVHNVHVL